MRFRARRSLFAFLLFVAPPARAQRGLPPGAVPATTAPEPAARVVLTPVPGPTAATPAPLAPLAPVAPGGPPLPSPTPGPSSGRTWTAPPPGDERKLELPGYAGPAGTPLGDPALFHGLSPLRRAWFVRQYYRNRGDDVSAQAALAAFADLKLDEGLDDAGSVASALAIESAADVRDRKAALAVDEATAAVALAPDFASTQFALARARGAAGDLGGALGSLSGAVEASLGNLRSWVRLAGNAAVIATAAAWIAFAVFLLVGFLRHGRFLAHDFAHALADKLPALVTAPILLLFLAFPVIFGLGLLPLAAWLTVALWLKLSLKERVAAGLFLLLGAGTPALIQRAAGYFAFEQGEAGRLYAAVHEDEVGPEELAALSSRADATGDPELLLTLGNLHLHEGRYAAAQAFYKRAEEKGAGVSAWVGQGVVSYAEGDVPAALALWQRAVQADAVSFAAHFNLYRVYNELTDLDRTNAEIASARNIDGRSFDRLKDQALPTNRKTVAEVGSGLPIVSAAYLNRLLVVDSVSSSRLLERAFASGDARTIARQSWQRISPGVPMGANSALFLAALALCGLITAAFQGVIAARPCPRCGKGICLRCDGPPLEGDYCVQCFHAFLHPEGTDPRERARKEREVVEKETGWQRRRKLLSLIFPGGGHLLGGDTVRGTVILLLASLGVARLALGPGLFRPSFPDPGPGGLIVGGLAGLLLLGAWIAGISGHAEARR